MPCYSPLKATRCQDGSIDFAHKAIGEPLKLPCGQCVGCRLERSRQWAVRCMHEAKLYERNAFITLTYNEDNLPSDRGLHYDHFQKFMKRLRFSHKGHQPLDDGTKPIRFYMCGEYGDKLSRPHFHACLFNFDFIDKYLWETSPSGSKLYRSPILEELWPYGYSSIGEVTFQSAAYVARYIMKKINGKDAADHYEYIDPVTGEIYNRRSEFTKMSLKPGIGKGWFDLYHDDVYPHDYVVVNGKQTRPPKYYDKKYQDLFESVSYINSAGEVIEYIPEWDEIKVARELDALDYVDNNTPDRLATRERHATLVLERLKRKLD